MYNRRSSYSSPTVLGIEEKFERPLVYVLGWITGLVFLLVERRNTNVRRHAYQSVVIFGALTIISLILGFIGGLAGGIPLIGGLFGLGFGALGILVTVISVLAWLLLIVLAFITPETFIGNHRRDLI
jgi:uncharacterized membrane protein